AATGGGVMGASLPLVRGSVTGRAVLDARTIWIGDLAEVGEEDYPVGRDIQRRTGIRSIVAVPMLRGGEAIGALTGYRIGLVAPFTPQQVRLLETFADQAVIAVENARLFQELADKSR